MRKADLDMRCLPSKVKRYENCWYGKYDPCDMPILIPTSVLGKPKENVHVFVRSPSGKE